ncbi:hypothetical protein [Ohtaekwangia koreensis]|uniref:hypothetical protein n=1 Tax=Ohtaekwangia koreensis TaxID=688867 RepID=UPI00117E0397|nr:hypothetical protein [Ohtaekwangia koreensis]
MAKYCLASQPDKAEDVDKVTEKLKSGGLMPRSIYIQDIEMCESCFRFTKGSSDVLFIRWAGIFKHNICNKQYGNFMKNLRSPSLPVGSDLYWLPYTFIFKGIPFLSQKKSLVTRSDSC